MKRPITRKRLPLVEDDAPTVDTPLSNIPSTPSGRNGAGNGTAITISTEKLDNDAIEIGELYRKGMIESANTFIECGRRLATKKASLHHGAWLPWLKKHAKVLGFESDRTAQRLMKFAETNPTPVSDLGEALQVSREIWGHTKRIEKAPETAPSEEAHAAEGRADRDVDAVGDDGPAFASNYAMAKKLFYGACETSPRLNTRKERGDHDALMDRIEDAQRRKFGATVADLEKGKTH